MPIQNVLFVVFGAGVLWIYWIVSGGIKGPDALTHKPHILKVTFENGYRTEFFCDSFDQGLEYLDRLDHVLDARLERALMT